MAIFVVWLVLMAGSVLTVSAQGKGQLLARACSIGVMSTAKS